MVAMIKKRFHENMSPSPKIHLISDIHLETHHESENPKYEIPPDLEFDLLLVAGDLSSDPEEGVKWLVANSKGRQCCVILGNHCLWSKGTVPRLKRIQRWRDLCDAPSNIHFLENNSIIFEEWNLRVLGATLWTDYGSSASYDGSPHEGLLNEAQHMMVDFLGEIGEGEAVRFTSRDALRLHNESMEFLRSELHQEFDGRTIILSHHSPSLESLRLAGMPEDVLTDSRLWRISRRSENTYFHRRAAYASDKKYFIDQFKNKIDLWVHGHLHSHGGTGPMHFVESGVHFRSNLKGYGWDPLSSFDPKLIIDANETLADVINEKLSPTIEKLKELTQEIEEFCECTVDAKGAIKTALQESIQNRATEFHEIFIEARTYALSNLHAGSLSRTNQIGPIIFSPGEDSGTRTCSFTGVKTYALYEETKRLIDSHITSLEKLQNISSLPEKARIDVIKRAGLGLFNVRTKGYIAEFYWEPLAAQKRWKHVAKEIGKVYVSGYKDGTVVDGTEDEKKLHTGADNAFRERFNLRLDHYWCDTWYNTWHQDGKLDHISDLKFPDGLDDAIAALKSPGDCIIEALAAVGMTIEDALDDGHFSFVYLLKSVISGEEPGCIEVTDALTQVTGMPQPDYSEIQADYDSKLIAVIAQFENSK